MSRFTDFILHHDTAIPVAFVSPTDQTDEHKPQTARPGLVARLAKLWTKSVERRHLRHSIERLTQLSDHLLDDAGLYDSTTPDTLNGPDH